MSLPAFSGLLASLIAAAAAAPDDIPTCQKESQNYVKEGKFSGVKATHCTIKETVCYCQHTSKPSFNARSLAVSMASSLEIWKVSQKSAVNSRHPCTPVWPVQSCKLPKRGCKSAYWNNCLICMSLNKHKKIHCILLVWYRNSNLNFCL